MTTVSGSIDRATTTRHGGAATAWLRRALHGLTWSVAALFIALAAVWTLSMTFHDFAGSWAGATFLPFLLIEVGGTFVSALLTALVMGLPILAIGNLGPQRGWRRVLALTAGILAVTPIAAAMRVVTYGLIDQSPPDFSPGPWMIVFGCRYAQQATLLTLMAEFHRHAIRNEQAMHDAEIDRLALDRDMAEARLQVMQAQIEPHFLFNTLANVRRLYQTDLATGRRMLDNLMRYLEVALPRMRAAHSSVDREIGLVEAYLGVQGVRMGHRLSFTIEVDPALRALSLPPMMLLTLVENAIKHGLNPLPEGGRIAISARRDGDRLRVAVVDDGQGFRDSSGAGTGLANIRARLSVLHADAASLSLSENAGRGVTSTLELPVMRIAEEAAA